MSETTPPNTPFRGDLIFQFFEEHPDSFGKDAYEWYAKQGDKREHMAMSECFRYINDRPTVLLALDQWLRRYEAEHKLTATVGPVSFGNA